MFHEKQSKKMKYQDLCIKLSEVLRAKGINTIYFEDVNLLNSEDVIYPAAVVQLVRVEQESHSDRYTIMVTIADNIQHLRDGSKDGFLEIANASSLKQSDNNYDYAIYYGNAELMTGVVNRWYTPNAILLPIDTTIYVSTNAKAVAIYCYDSPAWGLTRQIGVSRFYRGWTNVINLQYNTQAPYVRFQTSKSDNLQFSAKIKNSITTTPIMRSRDMRGINDILANDERIQINSCVTTPFRWKFRDEVEGITAEINLSLFFDSNCN